MIKSVSLHAAMLVAALLAGTVSAGAVPLDSATCASLDRERTSLESSGIINELHAKPEDARALDKEHVLRLQHYVDISGQLLFRCVPEIKPAVAEAPAPEVKSAPAASKRKTAVLKKK